MMPGIIINRLRCHNIVDPFEDTERSACLMTVVFVRFRHNIVDPFEDTESLVYLVADVEKLESQHRRSVRGY
mgnify:CR=1 FL=1